MSRKGRKSRQSEAVMTRKKYIWAGVTAIAVAAVIGLLLILSTGRAVALLQERVSSSLGRELKVAGSTRLEFSPTLALRLERVSLGGGSAMDDDFITAGQLHIPITFSGLFGRRLDLSEVTLRDAQVGLVIDEMGRTSWPEAPSLEPASVKLRLDNGAIRFFDRRTGQAFAFNEAAMAVDISTTGELTLAGTATINRQRAKLQAYVKDIARVSGSGSPAELSLEAPALSVNFNGRLATANGLGLAGTVTVSGPDLRGALRWAGGAPGGTLGLKAFTLRGGLDSTARAFGVRGADFTVDGIAGTGDLTLDFRGEAPKLQAVIATDAIDLDKYVPAASEADWGTAPLGYSALRGLDGAVTINAKDLIFSGVAFGPSTIAANLAAGRLDATIVSGASSEASVLLDGSGPIDEFALVFAGRNANAASLLGRLAGISWLEGAATFNTSLSATGKTQQEMISTLKGEVQIALADGWFRGLDIGRGLAAVAREMQKDWPGAGKGETPFTSLAASFTLADGLAQMKTLKVESPALAMSGTGEIDLLRRALDLRVDPRLVTDTPGETAGLPVAIVVKGPWARPRIYPDMANIVANPKAAYEALKGMGLPGAQGGN